MMAVGVSMPATRPPTPDRRRAERFPVHANVRVIGADSITAVAAHIVNISDNGAALKTSEPLRCGSTVYLDVPRFHLYGAAYVVRCGARFRGYLAGVEFKGCLMGCSAARPG